jgi:ribosomal protein S18 acetylase RimI-like enzyme
MEIIDFRPDLAPVFKALNEAWITRYFKLEPQDIEVLDDPWGTIIAPGGAVMFVGESRAENAKIVGCVALKAMDDGGFEVAKMAVVEGYKGQGLGRMLMQACVDRALVEGGTRLYLETNSALAPALSLYRSFGFKEIPGMKRGADDYERVDVWMELKL